VQNNRTPVQGKDSLRSVNTIALLEKQANYNAVDTGIRIEQISIRSLTRFENM
jgi:hypothetical protein